MFKVTKDKKGAIELSIGTVVIIVLAMSMLILGLVLVRGIFKGATESVTNLNDKVKGEITSLFVEDSSDVAVRLGADKRVRIEAGGDRIGVAMGARKEGAILASRGDLVYQLSADTAAADNCYTQLGSDISKVQAFFQYSFGTSIQFDQFQDDTAFAIMEIQIPEGTPSCTQKIFVDVEDSGGAPVGSDFFIIEVFQGGIFS